MDSQRLTDEEARGKKAEKMETLRVKANGLHDGIDHDERHHHGTEDVVYNAGGSRAVTYPTIDGEDPGLAKPSTAALPACTVADRETERGRGSSWTWREEIKRINNYTGRPESALSIDTRAESQRESGESKVITVSNCATSLVGPNGNWITLGGMDKGLGLARMSPPSTAYRLGIGWARATEESDWTDRLPDSAASLAGLNRGSGGAGRERTAPSLDDAAFSEGLGRGNGVVRVDEIGCNQYYYV